SEIVYIEVNGMYVYLMVSHSPSYNSVSLLSDLSKTLQTISFDRTPEELVQRTSFANGLLELDWDGGAWDNKWESDSITLLKKNEPESSSYFYSYPSKENSDRAQIH